MSSESKSFLCGRWTPISWVSVFSNHWRRSCSPTILEHFIIRPILEKATGIIRVTPFEIDYFRKYAQGLVEYLRVEMRILLVMLVYINRVDLSGLDKRGEPLRLVLVGALVLASRPLRYTTEEWAKRISCSTSHLEELKNGFVDAMRGNSQKVTRLDIIKCYDKAAFVGHESQSQPFHPTNPLSSSGQSSSHQSHVSTRSVATIRSTFTRRDQHTPHSFSASQSVSPSQQSVVTTRPQFPRREQHIPHPFSASQFIPPSKQSVATTRPQFPQRDRYAPSSASQFAPPSQRSHAPRSRRNVPTSQSASARTRSDYKGPVELVTPGASTNHYAPPFGYFGSPTRLASPNRGAGYGIPRTVTNYSTSPSAYSYSHNYSYTTPPIRLPQGISLEVTCNIDVTVVGQRRQ